MASRFPSTSTLHQRDPRSALFDGYTGDRNRTHSASPSAGQRSPYGVGAAGPSSGGPGLHANGAASPGFRPGTPNARSVFSVSRDGQAELMRDDRGQYSDALLSSLESQNDEQISVLSDKVRMFKDMTVAIGSEIRASSSLADSLNDSFDNTRVRLKGTMGRMLRMAQRTGVGWRAWLVLFGVVTVLFWFVWIR
ncbi:MAG: protein transport protein bet1 [Thelocarpon impressellum]|nr:MAG: protein transport protein bet1 [Thelocarpon impressellum]